MFPGNVDPRYGLGWFVVGLNWQRLIASSVTLYVTLYVALAGDAYVAYGWLPHTQPFLFCRDGSPATWFRIDMPLPFYYFIPDYLHYGWLVLHLPGLLLRYWYALPTT